MFTKVETLRKKPTTSYDCLVESLINPADISHLPQIAQGTRLEAEAIQKVRAMLTECGHKNIQVVACGIFIDRADQYLGAIMMALFPVVAAKVSC